MHTTIKLLEQKAITEVLNGIDPDGDANLMYIPSQFTEVFSKLLIESVINTIRNQYDLQTLNTPLRERIVKEIAKEFNYKR